MESEQEQPLSKTTSQLYAFSIQDPNQNSKMKIRTSGTVLVFNQCSTRSKINEWNNARFYAMFHSIVLERVEHCLKTSVAPLVHSWTSGTLLKNKHCSTRSNFQFRFVKNKKMFTGIGRTAQRMESMRTAAEFAIQYTPAAKTLSDIVAVIRKTR